MKLCQLPTPLQPGDLLRVVAPSGALRELSAFNRGVEVWRDRGYRVEFTAGYDDRVGYLAGTDQVRRAALETALNDPDCRGILCARGGWGGARLLEKWAFPPVEPKWLIGFSDITSLLWAYSCEGVAGVHAPLLTTIAAEPDWSKQRLFDLVEGRSLPPLTGVGWASHQRRIHCLSRFFLIALSASARGSIGSPSPTVRLFRRFGVWTSTNWLRWRRFRLRTLSSGTGLRTLRSGTGLWTLRSGIRGGLSLPLRFFDGTFYHCYVLFYSFGIISRLCPDGTDF